MLSTTEAPEGSFSHLVSLGHLVNQHVGACVFEMEVVEVGGRRLEYTRKGINQDRFLVGHHLD